MSAKIGFSEAKRRLITALQQGSFRHAARDGVETKNLLQMGQITSEELSEIVKRCSGQHHQSSPHHQAEEVDVHVLKRDGWYVKFYFLDLDTIFISVHM